MPALFEQAGVKEEEARTRAKHAREQYQEGLRRVLYDF
jgi:hypothetical protein